MIRLSADLADDVIAQASIAALYYDEADELVTPGSVDRDVDTIMALLAMTDMDDAERGRLRDVCRGAIVDPTTHRRELIRLVLSAVDNGPALF